MVKIGIIGAGAFGATTAIELSKVGFDVTIFEKNKRILSEGTANSQNRLHLGLHYPRDLETAIQSKAGFDNFLEVYPDLVRNDFPNYYAISSTGSKVTSEEFQDFAQKAGIELIDHLNASPFGIASENIDGIWKCEEGVIDIDLFRTKLETEISSLKIKLELQTKICQITRELELWTLRDEQGNLYKDFDFIVRATYGNDQLESNDLDLKATEYEYHRTLILEVRSPNPPTGITIVDGDFLTVLPKGFTDNFLIYAPSISVLDKSRGFEPKSNWADTEAEIAKAQNSLINRTQTWLPNFAIHEIVDRLITTRSVQPNVSSTDKRVSEIKWLDQTVVEIWSGKIDHCIEISESITQAIKLKSKV
jgi:glycine/D-amino acid oxidase-like deaminating enzyme